MSRLTIPATVEATPAASQPQLEAVRQHLGSVPNMFRLLAQSPAALGGYLALSGALGKGRLDGPTQERLALTVAGFNGCSYCLSAHSYLGKHVAKLDDAELEAARNGTSTDSRSAAALAFAARVVEQRGHVTDADLRAVKAAGYDEAQVLEIVLHVALNTLTNYVNEVAQTDVDFPVVTAPARKAA